MSDLVAVENLSLRLGAFALRNLNLTVAAGEILVLLGPNGAGKSMTLETIAGFHRPQAGRIVIAGRDVTRLPPERRQVGLVFQNFALFPHLSVAQNVAIAVRRGGGPAPAGSSVPLGDAAALLPYFSIAHLANRRPHDLSAGERQRTSLARAFAARPNVLLFDEPFSSLDAPTCEQLRRDLGDFIRAAGIPAIFVTHDSVEARVMADRIAVIDAGTLLQEGSAADIFERPCNAVVARLVGCENVLSGEVAERVGDRTGVAVGSSVIWSKTSANLDRGQRVTVYIRGENVRLHSATPIPNYRAVVHNSYQGRIIATTNLGPLTNVTLDCGFTLYSYVMTGEIRGGAFSIGADARVEIDAGLVHLSVES
jgi:molybdate/tungstate transport system ATP-binding protein